MSAQHTPGPWRVELEGYDSDYGYVVERAGIRAENGGLFIADVEPHDEAHADIAANARLIAAAPDLLALLKELIDIEGPQPGHIEWARKVQAAIAKAEGQSARNLPARNELERESGRRDGE